MNQRKPNKTLGDLYVEVVLVIGIPLGIVALLNWLTL
jgi:hypothetical protein